MLRHGFILQPCACFGKTDWSVAQLELTPRWVYKGLAIAYPALVFGIPGLSRGMRCAFGLLRQIST